MKGLTPFILYLDKWQTNRKAQMYFSKLTNQTLSLKMESSINILVTGIVIDRVVDFYREARGFGLPLNMPTKWPG